MNNINTQNLVSIVIPVFNCEKYIFQTLNSLKLQTYENYEVIIIDDFSSDDSLKIIENFCKKDKRFRYFSNPYNIGAGKSRNYGTKKAKGKYIAYLDSDDWWPDDKLEKQINFMEEREILFSCTDMKMMKDNSYLKTAKTSDIVTLEEFLLKTNIFCSSVMISKEISEISEFSSWKIRQPFKKWCGILSKRINCYKVPDTYVYYLIRPKSISRNKLEVLPYTIAAYILFSKKPFTWPFFFLSYILNSFARNKL